jgi:hypothetical protein
MVLMLINLYPVRRDDTLEVSRNGNVLTLNGEDFDLSQLLDGSTLPASAIASPWFNGPIDNVDGRLVMTLILPIPANYSPEQAFPLPIHALQDGPVHLPQPLPKEPANDSAGVESEVSDGQH